MLRILTVTKPRGSYIVLGYLLVKYYFLPHPPFKFGTWTKLNNTFTCLSWCYTITPSTQNYKRMSEPGIYFMNHVWSQSSEIFIHGSLDLYGGHYQYRIYQQGLG